MAVARAYEEQIRRAVVLDVSDGTNQTAAAIRRALDHLGTTSSLRTVSADLISTAEEEGGPRVIEVKGRGSSGPIQAPERELETLAAAGLGGWLYVVWNTTQPRPYRLLLVQDPQTLPWTTVRPAARPACQARGVRHEALLRVEARDVEEAGVEVDVSGLADLPTK